MLHHRRELSLLRLVPLCCQICPLSLSLRVMINSIRRPLWPRSSRCTASTTIPPRCIPVQRLPTRLLTTEVQSNRHSSSNIHISIFNKGFAYQPIIKDSALLDLPCSSPEEIKAQSAALLGPLGWCKASLRRSEKLLRQIDQRHELQNLGNARSVSKNTATRMR